MVLLIYLNVAPQFVDRDDSGNPKPPAPSGHPARSTSAMGGPRFDLKRATPGLAQKGQSGTGSHKHEPIMAWVRHANTDA